MRLIASENPFETKKTDGKFSIYVLNLNVSGLARPFLKVSLGIYGSHSLLINGHNLFLRQAKMTTIDPHDTLCVCFVLIRIFHFGGSLMYP